MIFHLLMYSLGPEWRVENRGTLRMLMNDKIMFDLYFCINSAQTKEIMVHFSHFLIGKKLSFYAASQLT